MNITVSRGGKYKDVEVILDNTKVPLGLHDEEECMKLACMLKAAIQDLIDDQHKCQTFLEYDV